MALKILRHAQPAGHRLPSADSSTANEGWPGTIRSPAHSMTAVASGASAFRMEAVSSDPCAADPQSPALSRTITIVLPLREQSQRAAGPTTLRAYSSDKALRGDSGPEPKC